MLARLSFTLALAMVLAGTLRAAPAEGEEGIHRIAPGDRLGVGFLFAPPGERPVTPGDRLKLGYHFHPPEPGRPYKVQPGDEIDIFFPYSPDRPGPLVMLMAYSNVPQEDSYRSLSGRFQVQPEGTLVLRALDQPLAVIDRSTTEIARMATEAYGGILSDARANVSVQPRLKREEALRRMLAADGQGPCLLTLTVPPSGRILVPGTAGPDGDNPAGAGLMAAGLTADEIGERLTRRYRDRRYRHLTVTAWVDQPADPIHEGLRSLLGGGGALSAPVLASGELSLPLAPGHPVAGKTAARVGRELTERYRGLGYDRIQVAVWIEEAASAQ